MLTIRLSRTGKRKQPMYRIVVQESSRDPWSPAIEIIGNLNPRLDRKDAVVNQERAAYWLSVGAQPSASVNNLFVDLGLVKGKKQNKITITASRAKTIVDNKAKAIEKEAAKKETALKKAAEEKEALEAKKAEEKAAKEAKLAEEAAAKEVVDQAPVAEAVEAPKAEEKAE